MRGDFGVGCMIASEEDMRIRMGDMGGGGGPGVLYGDGGGAEGHV